MEYIHVPGIGKPVSRLIQGNTMIGTDDLDHAFTLLDAVHAAGCTAFDTAHIYGSGACERALGAWLAARDLREEIVVITKGAHPNADRARVTPHDITSDLFDSLARLKTEYIDLYLLHRDDPEVPVSSIVDILNHHLEAGRIRAFGGSNWSHQRLEEANAYAESNGLVPFTVSSPHMSLAEMLNAPWAGCISIAGPNQTPARDWYTRTGIPVFSWSSLCGGFFSGRDTPEDIMNLTDEWDMRVHCYRNEANLERLRRAFTLAEQKKLTVPQVVTAYLLNQPFLVAPLVGCVSGEEYAALAQVLALQLTQGEMAWLNLECDSIEENKA